MTATRNAASRNSSRSATGTGRSYFEARYSGDPDPWRFETSSYEQRKYAITLAALPRGRYRRGVEPGCSNGVLSSLLAERCGELFSFDFIGGAVERARHRLRDRPNVRVVAAEFPTYWPHGRGDLVVWSEVAYYLSDAGWNEAILGLDRWLDPGGTLVAVHYTGQTDYPLTGAQVAERIDEIPFLERTTTVIDEAFELGVWVRVQTQ